MERDFLGLSSKNNVSVTVKEETFDDSNTSALLRGSGMQWSFSNKVSAVPQFLSFRSAQEDRPRRNVNDSIPSSGFMTISTADAFDSNQKPYSGLIQKNLITDKQAGSHYAMTVYPHFDAHSVHRPQEVRIFPVSNQLINQTSPVALGTTVLQSHLASTGQNVVGSAVKPQPLGDFGPPRGSMVGTTDLRNASKSSGAPAQLTIFYAGSVSCFDDVTPEKAQAIMLMAGNGSSPAHNLTQSIAQEQALIPRPSPSEGLIKTQSHTTTLFPGLPTPLSLTAKAGSQSGVGASSTNELVTGKPRGSSSFPTKHSEPPQVVSPAGCAATTLIPTVGLPQARKASLARFLEKRKERGMNASPYNVSKNYPDCSTPGSDGVGYSVNSTGSCPHPAIK
ncbi:protein TIFY 6B-like isoform X1 [Fagus crenata]